MKRLDSGKLSVQMRPEVTLTPPVTPRCYTVTRSEATGELCLNIGTEYARDMISPQRDEVLSEWRVTNKRYYLYVYVNVDVDGQFGPMASAVRYAVFRRELPLALEAIRFADREFFEAYPALDSVPIWIYFDSVDPYYKGIELWGTMADYK